MAETALAPDDLRAAVAAGILSEAQAASTLALAQSRAGHRLGMAAEDEPFELFKGFAEIFITVGLSILFFAGFGLLALMQAPLAFLIALPVCALLARYFTLRRRMVLPSIFLTLCFGAALATAALGYAFQQMMPRLAGVAVGAALNPDGADQVMQRGAAAAQSGVLIALAVIAAGLLLWFRLFRVPFTMLLLGLCGLAAILTATNVIPFDALLSEGVDALRDSLDLSSGRGLGLAMMAFGLIALAGGIWFDMRDPHRLGRMSASGFWLHVLAAPALVNTLALTFLRMGPGAGYSALVVVLLCATLLALIIDRRSFLTTGLGYMIFLTFYSFGRPDVPMTWLSTLLLIGAGMTALGAGWIALRARLMRMLPDFPGKNRLPPWN